MNGGWSFENRRMVTCPGGQQEAILWMSCTRDTRHGPRWGGGVHSFFEVIVYRDITTSFYREIPHALDEPELQSRVSLRFSPYSP